MTKFNILHNKKIQVTQNRREILLDEFHKWNSTVSVKVSKENRIYFIPKIQEQTMIL